MVRDPIRQGYSFKEWSSVPNPPPNTIYKVPNFKYDCTVYALWQEQKADAWTNVTSLSQVNGTWKGSYTVTNTQSSIQTGDITVRLVGNITLTINASKETMSGSHNYTATYSGDNINILWPYIKEELSSNLAGSTLTFNNSNHSVTVTENMPSELISLSDIDDWLINQNGTKLKIPADEELPEIIFTKQ